MRERERERERGKEGSKKKKKSGGGDVVGVVCNFESDVEKHRCRASAESLAFRSLPASNEISRSLGPESNDGMARARVKKTRGGPQRIDQGAGDRSKAESNFFARLLRRLHGLGPANRAP